MSAPLAPEVAAAYAHCESVTRARAANFYYGIRLLSAERRRAMSAVYAFSREVDDIGDDEGGLSAGEKLSLLDAREAALVSLDPSGAARLSATGAGIVESAPDGVGGAPADPAASPSSAMPVHAATGAAAGTLPEADPTSILAEAGAGASLTEQAHVDRLATRFPNGGRLVSAREARALAEPGADPVIVALTDACERFPIPVGALRELIEGVRMDVREVGYEHFGELVPYCRRVAGAIGRVCLAIFALRAGARADRGTAESLADDLGVALQLTNILRDVREDAENGRVYLPLEDLRRFGLLQSEAGSGGGGEAQRASARMAALARAAGEANGGMLSRQSERDDLDRLAELVRFEAARAREWFARGGRLAPLLDRRSAACLLAMAGIYSRLLDRIEARPLQAAAQRMSLPAHEKAWVATRAMLGMQL